MIIVGIDPGLTGGVAVLKDGSLKDIFKMPRGNLGINANALHRKLLDIQPDLIVLEHVGVHFASSRLASFTFGTVFGMTLAVVELIPTKSRLVRPKDWQKGVGATIFKGTPKERAKTAFKACFKQDAPAHDGIIDAALIAYYGLLIAKTV